MPLLRLQNNVPEVYVDQSRDFQMLCRAYDSILNGVKFDIDTIQYLSNTNRCSSRALRLLQTKVGFLTKVDLDDEALRYTLKVFPFMMKNKGNLKSINQAVSVFLAVNHISLPTDIVIDNDTYTVNIRIQHRFNDTSVLDELLKYILPAGYTYDYTFEEGVSNTTRFVEDDYIGAVFSSDINTSVVRDSQYSSGGSLHNYSDAPSFANRIIGAVDTLEVASEDSEEAYDTDNTVQFFPPANNEEET